MSTVRYNFHMKRAAAGAPKRVVVGSAPIGTTEAAPRIARLLALAHKFQGMLERGEVESMADLARLGRVSRARITQIMDLLLLAPEIQEEVLFGLVHARFSQMVALVSQVVWAEQRSRYVSSRKPAIAA